jgi:hypothetical protein
MRRCRYDRDQLVLLDDVAQPNRQAPNDPGVPRVHLYNGFAVQPNFARGLHRNGDVPRRDGARPNAGAIDRLGVQLHPPFMLRIRPRIALPGSVQYDARFEGVWLDHRSRASKAASLGSKRDAVPAPAESVEHDVKGSFHFLVRLPPGAVHVGAELGRDSLLGDQQFESKSISVEDPAAARAVRGFLGVVVGVVSVRPLVGLRARLAARRDREEGDQHAEGGAPPHSE